MTTQRETVRLLCKSLVTRLENNKAIAFPPRLRQIVQDEVFDLVGPYILTEQDIRERALKQMGIRADVLGDTGSAESEQYKAAKAVVKGQIGDDELNGFFFQKPIKNIAQTVSAYLMRSSHIDEVFDSDEDLEREIVHTIQKFDPKNVH